MSRVRLLDRDDAPLTVRHLFPADGHVSSLRRSLANAPDLLEVFMPFLAHVCGPTSIDLATKEIVTVRVSQLNACSYCLAAHRPAALDAGVTEAELAAICNEGPVAALDVRERTLVEWVDCYILDPVSIDDELVARMLDHFRDDQLIELAFVAGVTQLLNHYCTAFAIPPERA
jgi:AhpD family alkylhydroperoxidase